MNIDIEHEERTAEQILVRQGQDSGDQLSPPPKSRQSKAEVRSAAGETATPITTGATAALAMARPNMPRGVESAKMGAEDAGPWDDMTTNEHSK